MKKVFFFWLFFLFVLIFSLIGCSNDEEKIAQKPIASFADSTVVAIVNGEAIHIQDIEKSAQQIGSQLGAGQEMYREQFQDTLRNEAFNWIVSMKLLSQEAAKQKIEPEQEEIDEALQAIKSRFPSEQHFNDALQQNNITNEEFLANLKNELVVHKLLEEKVVKEVGEISDSEARDFYNKNQDQFTKSEKARVHHILLRVRNWSNPDVVNEIKSRGLEIIQKLKNGGDFEDLARRYSDDPSAAKGGDLGEFSRGDMLKEFEEATFQLEEGEFSDLVQTKLGFHIIKLDEKVGSQKIPYEQVEAEIKQIIQQNKSNQLFEKYVLELRDKADIKIRNNSADS